MPLLWRMPRRFSAKETLIAAAQNVQHADPGDRLNYFRLPNRIHTTDGTARSRH